MALRTKEEVGALYPPGRKIRDNYQELCVRWNNHYIVWVWTWMGWKMGSIHTSLPNRFRNL